MKTSLSPIAKFNISMLIIIAYQGFSWFITRNDPKGWHSIDLKVIGIWAGAALIGFSLGVFNNSSK